MSAHPGSQCAKCGMDVHGEELCGWCEADVLRVALEEARRERDEARAAFEQKAYPTESCRKERALGNGGCGACALCCAEAVAQRDAAQADAYEKVQALAAVSGILLGNDVPSTWDCYGAVADARKRARERDEEAK